jgi:hypothetical protein
MQFSRCPIEKIEEREERECVDRYYWRAVDFEVRQARFIGIT